MKFMKLGSKPDIFVVRSNVTSVASELPSDITLDVDGHKFHLHKFPLLAKWGCLNKLLAEAQESECEEVTIGDFPGGAGCFEMCAKFCYGITITLSPHNVGEVRCGAEYLQMSETMEKGNLIYKLDVFLNSSILRGWKDTIICLQYSKAHMPWAEDIKIIGRCIDSISSKATVDPGKVDWSYTSSRQFRSSVIHHASGIEQASPATWNETHGRGALSPAPKDWWVEDISELDIDLYRRVMVAIKAKGMSQELVGAAIQVYALKWLPGVSKEHTMLDNPGMITEETSYKHLEMATKNKHLLETIVSLLPSEKGASSCTFLLKLLKAATVLDASSTTRMELARRVGLQLEEAPLCDLLIPSLSYSSDAIYDVDLVMRIMEHYLMQNHSPPGSPEPNPERPHSPNHRRGDSVENIDFSGNNHHHHQHHRLTSATNTSMLKVAKLIDRYLAEIARDANLPLPKFMQLAESVPDFARPIHDNLYRAIDMYLKEHPGLTKSERKKICRLMDCKKLSMDACMHAAQNDRLPLRVVVQVLFFEQVRTAVNGGLLLSDLPANCIRPPEYGEEINLPEVNATNSTSNPNNTTAPSTTVGDETWETVHQDFSALKGDLASMKLRIAEAERERSMMQRDDNNNNNKQLKAKGVLSAFKPEKILNKLFSSKGFSSSESSRDSASPELAAGKATSKPQPQPQPQQQPQQQQQQQQQQHIRHSFA